MKAIRHPDGRIEYEGSPEEIATATGLAPAVSIPPQPSPLNGHAAQTKTPSKALKYGAKGVRHPGALPARILALLSAEPGKVFSPAVIADMLHVGAKAARGTLNRLAKEEKPPAVLYAGRGQYRAMPREATQ